MDDGAVNPDPAIGPLSAFDYIMRELPLPQEVDLYELLWQEPVNRPRRSGTLSEASSSAAPPSDHPGAEGAVTGTRVRQSVLYSDNPRRPRRRQGAAPYPGAEGAGTETRVRQSILYSDHPRRLRHRGPAPDVEHHDEVSSSGLGRAATELPTFEALSVSDSILLTPEPSEESDDDPTAGDEIRTVGERVHFSLRPKGISRAMVLSLGDSLFQTVTIKEHKPSTFTDEEIEEELRLCKEYFETRPKNFLESTLTALAAELRRERLDRETQPLQALQQASAAAAQPELSMEQKKPSYGNRPEASVEELIENGKKWMRDEVMLAFDKYFERTAELKGHVYRLDKLCHQCLNVESYNNVFHHYNFTVKMKNPSSVDWIVELYFAEVKEIFGRKHYFCCPLESNENGHCYACENQGMEELKHPATGGFDMGSPDGGFSSWYTDE